MIKPPASLIMLSAALVQLFGGCLNQICISPFHLNQIPLWQEVKSCLQSPIDLLKAINEFQTLLSQGRIKKDNVLVSMHLMNHELSKDGIYHMIEYALENQDKLISQIILIMSDCIKTLHAQARQHFKVYNIDKCPIPQRQPAGRYRSTSRSLSQSQHNTSASKSKQFFVTQSISHKKKLSISSTPKQLSSAKKYLSRSSTHSLPKYNDLQKRVQLANLKKIGRLDRILNLQVRKPKVESQVKLLRQGLLNNSSRSPKVYGNDRSTQQRQALQEELAQNQAAIKALKHEELEVKWMVEREVKYIQNQDEGNQLRDQLNRSKLQHQLNEQQETKKKLSYLREQQHKTNESVIMKQKESYQKKSGYHDENLISSMVLNDCQESNQFEDTVKLEGLKSEYIYTQKQKVELEHSLQKIMSKFNDQTRSDKRFNY